MIEKVSLTLETGNAAFEDEPAAEIARILREAARRIENMDFDGTGFRLKDINGNTCGRVTIEKAEDEEDEEEEE